MTIKELVLQFDCLTQTAQANAGEINGIEACQLLGIGYKLME